MVDISLQLLKELFQRLLRSCDLSHTHCVEPCSLWSSQHPAESHAGYLVEGENLQEIMVFEIRIIKYGGLLWMFPSTNRLSGALANGSWYLAEL